MKCYTNCFCWFIAEPRKISQALKAVGDRLCWMETYRHQYWVIFCLEFQGLMARRSNGEREQVLLQVRYFPATIQTPPDRYTSRLHGFVNILLIFDYS